MSVYIVDLKKLYISSY